MLLVSVQLLPGASRAAIVQSPESSASVDRARGIELFKQNRFRDAVGSLQKAVKKDGQDYDAWYFLGLALMKTNDLKNATKCLEQAVKLKPNSAPAHNGLAYAFLLRNKLADTVSEAHATLNIDPQMTEPHYFLGVARLRMDAPKDALAEAETAIKLNPLYPAGYLLKSEALVRLHGDLPVSDSKSRIEKQSERYGEAAAALEEYLKLDPEPENKETWVEQLESLKVYSIFHQPNVEGAMHSNREGAVKAVILSKPQAGYTEEARRNQTKGTVVIKAIFAADGKVKHILVIKALPDGLTQKCIKAALAIKFIPATIDGKPVSMFLQLEYSFDLH